MIENDITRKPQNRDANSADELIWNSDRWIEHDCLVRKHHPFVPADAGTQLLLQSLGPRFRGDERSLMSRFRSIDHVLAQRNPTWLTQKAGCNVEPRCSWKRPMGNGLVTCKQSPGALMLAASWAFARTQDHPRRQMTKARTLPRRAEPLPVGPAKRIDPPMMFDTCQYLLYTLSGDCELSQQGAAQLLPR
jgi:hypothetical protein